MTGNDAEMQNVGDSESEICIDIAHYRKIVKLFIDMRRYQSALFWAEKVCVLSQNDPKDVYCLAHCMFLLQEYHRSAHTIQVFELEKSHLPCYNLLLESLYEAKEFNEAIAVINSVDVEHLATSLINQPPDNLSKDSHSLYNNEEGHKNELLASVNLLKAKVYEAMDNRGMALEFYLNALHRSIYCYEALDALAQHEMLMAWEERELMQHLPFSQQATEPDAKLIKKLYESKLKKYCESIGTHCTNVEETPISNIATIKKIREQTEKIQKTRSDGNVHLNFKYLTPNATNIMSPANKLLEDLKNTSFSLSFSLSRYINDTCRPHMETSILPNPKDADGQNILSLATCYSRLQQSTDLMAADAEKYFYDCEYKKCKKVLNELLKIDPYHDGGLIIQIGYLIEFNDYNTLFYVAHKLVDRYPDKAISWYAVGCYYDLINKSDPARRYLSKATTLDRLFGPAWLAYGHSFAKENEHDQAMAAYFKATQLMRGCHLPLLYIGVECGLTKNLELAEKFFYQAMSIAPLDVFVLHELGVIKYEYEYYESAEDVFRATVELVKRRATQNNEEIAARWEPLFNNLAHCCRKTKKYKEALEFHEFALLLKPLTAQTFTAMGFVHALMGNLEDAVTYFHKSLFINRDCVVTTTILKTCIEDLMDEETASDTIFGKELRDAASLNMPKTIKKTLPTIHETPLPYNCMKLNFDDEDFSANSDNIDANVIMDMSMDI